MTCLFHFSPTLNSLKYNFSRFVHTQKGFDVFNALDLMENKTFLEKLKFGIGDGNLQYYLYNWKCPSMGAEKVHFPMILLQKLVFPARKELNVVYSH